MSPDISSSILIVDDLTDMCLVTESSIVFCKRNNSFYFGTIHGWIRFQFPKRGHIGPIGGTGCAGQTGGLGSGRIGRKGHTGGTGVSGIGKLGDKLVISPDENVFKYTFPGHRYIVGCNNLYQPDPYTIEDDINTTIFEYFHNLGTTDLIIEFHDEDCRKIDLASSWIIRVTSSSITFNAQALKYLSPLSDQLKSHNTIYINISPLKDFIEEKFHLSNYNYIKLPLNKKEIITNSQDTPITHTLTNNEIPELSNNSSFKILYYIDFNGNDITYTLTKVSNYSNDLKNNTISFDLTQQFNNTNPSSNSGYLIYSLTNENLLDNIVIKPLLSNLKSYKRIPKIKLSIPFTRQFKPFISHYLNYNIYLKKYFNTDNIAVKVKIYPSLPNQTHYCHIFLENSEYKYIHQMDYNSYPHNNTYINAKKNIISYPINNYTYNINCPNANISNSNPNTQFQDISNNIPKIIKYFNCSSNTLITTDVFDSTNNISLPTHKGIFYDYRHYDNSNIELIFFKCNKILPLTIYCTGIIEIEYDTSKLPPFQIDPLTNEILLDENNNPLEYSGPLWLDDNFNLTDYLLSTLTLTYTYDDIIKLSNILNSQTPNYISSIPDYNYNSNNISCINYKNNYCKEDTNSNLIPIIDTYTSIYDLFGAINKNNIPDLQSISINNGYLYQYNKLSPLNKIKEIQTNLNQQTTKYIDLNKSNNKIYTKILEGEILESSNIYIDHSLNINSNDIYSILAYEFDSNTNSYSKLVGPDEIIYLDNHRFIIRFKSYSKLTLCNYKTFDINYINNILKLNLDLISNYISYSYLLFNILQFDFRILTSSYYSKDSKYYPDNRPDLPPNRYTGQIIIPSLTYYHGLDFIKVNGIIYDEYIHNNFFNIYPNLSSTSYIRTNKAANTSDTLDNLLSCYNIYYTKSKFNFIKSNFIFDISSTSIKLSTNKNKTKTSISNFNSPIIISCKENVLSKTNNTTFDYTIAFNNPYSSDNKPPNSISAIQDEVGCLLGTYQIQSSSSSMTRGLFFKIKLIPDNQYITTSKVSLPKATYSRVSVNGASKGYYDGNHAFHSYESYPGEYDYLNTAFQYSNYVDSRNSTYILYRLSKDGGTQIKQYNTNVLTNFGYISKNYVCPYELVLEDIFLYDGNSDISDSYTLTEFNLYYNYKIDIITHNNSFKLTYVEYIAVPDRYYWDNLLQGYNPYIPVPLDLEIAKSRYGGNINALPRYMTFCTLFRTGEEYIADEREYDNKKYIATNLDSLTEYDNTIGLPNPISILANTLHELNTNYIKNYPDLKKIPQKIIYINFKFVYNPITKTYTINLSLPSPDKSNFTYLPEVILNIPDNFYLLDDPDNTPKYKSNYGIYLNNINISNPNLQEITINSTNPNTRKYFLIIDENKILIYYSQDNTLFLTIPAITNICTPYDIIDYDSNSVYIFNYQTNYPDLTDLLIKAKHLNLPDDFTISPQLINLDESAKIRLSELFYNIKLKEYYQDNYNIQQELELTNLDDLRNITNYEYQNKYFNVITDEEYPTYGERHDPECVDFNIAKNGWISFRRKFKNSIKLIITNHSVSSDNTFQEYIPDYYNKQYFNISNPNQYLISLMHNQKDISKRNSKISLYNKSGNLIDLNKYYYVRYFQDYLEIYPKDYIVKTKRHEIITNYSTVSIKLAGKLYDYYDYISLDTSRLTKRENVSINRIIKYLEPYSYFFIEYSAPRYGDVTINDRRYKFKMNFTYENNNYEIDIDAIYKNGNKIDLLLSRYRTADDPRYYDKVLTLANIDVQCPRFSDGAFHTSWAAQFTLITKHPINGYLPIEAHTDFSKMTYKYDADMYFEDVETGEKFIATQKRHVGTIAGYINYTYEFNDDDDRSRITNTNLSKGYHQQYVYDAPAGDITFKYSYTYKLTLFYNNTKYDLDQSKLDSYVSAGIPGLETKLKVIKEDTKHYKFVNLDVSNKLIAITYSEYINERPSGSILFGSSIYPIENTDPYMNQLLLIPFKYNDILKYLPLEITEDFLTKYKIDNYSPIDDANFHVYEAIIDRQTYTFKIGYIDHTLYINSIEDTSKLNFMEDKLSLSSQILNNYTYITGKSQVPSAYFDSVSLDISLASNDYILYGNTHVNDKDGYLKITFDDDSVINLSSKELYELNFGALELDYNTYLSVNNLSGGDLHLYTPKKIKSIDSSVIYKYELKLANAISIYPQILMAIDIPNALHSYRIFYYDMDLKEIKYFVFNMSDFSNIPDVFRFDSKTRLLWIVKNNIRFLRPLISFFDYIQIAPYLDPTRFTYPDEYCTAHTYCDLDIISSWPNYISDDQAKICLENQDTSLIAKDINIYEDIGPESLNIPIFIDKNNKKNFICSSFAFAYKPSYKINTISTKFEVGLKRDIAYYDSYLIDEYNVDMTNDYNNRNDFAKSYNYDFSPIYSADSSKFLQQALDGELVYNPDKYKDLTNKPCKILYQPKHEAFLGYAIIERLPSVSLAGTGGTGGYGDVERLFHNPRWKGGTGATGSTGEMGQTGGTGEVGATGSIGGTGSSSIYSTGGTGHSGGTGTITPEDYIRYTGSTGTHGGTGGIGGTPSSWREEYDPISGAYHKVNRYFAPGGTGGIGGSGSTGSIGGRGPSQIIPKPGPTGGTGAHGLLGFTGHPGSSGSSGETILDNLNKYLLSQNINDTIDSIILQVGINLTPIIISSTYTWTCTDLKIKTLPVDVKLWLNKIIGSRQLYELDNSSYSLVTSLTNSNIICKYLDSFKQKNYDTYKNINQDNIILNNNNILINLNNNLKSFFVNQVLLVSGLSTPTGNNDPYNLYKNLIYQFNYKLSNINNINYFEISTINNNITNILPLDKINIADIILKYNYNNADYLFTFTDCTVYTFGYLKLLLNLIYNT